MAPSLVLRNGSLDLFHSAGDQRFSFRYFSEIGVPTTTEAQSQSRGVLICLYSPPSHKVMEKNLNLEKPEAEGFATQLGFSVSLW